MATEVRPQKLRIEYSGPCEEDAEALGTALSQGPAIEPQRTEGDTARMAVGEIVLTIMLSAAARALVDVSIEKLRDYLEKRIQERNRTSREAPNLKVVLERMDGNRVVRRIALRVATVELVTKFVQNLVEDAAKAIGG